MKGEIGHHVREAVLDEADAYLPAAVEAIVTTKEQLHGFITEGSHRHIVVGAGCLHAGHE